MKFCPVVPEIWRRIIIIIRNGAKTISLQTLFGRLNYQLRRSCQWSSTAIFSISIQPDYSNLIWCKSMLNMMLITTKMSSEKYINSTYSLSESILRLDFINSNAYFKFRIFSKKLVFF